VLNILNVFIFRQIGHQQGGGVCLGTDCLGQHGGRRQNQE
jgi:hypothetical protein